MLGMRSTCLLLIVCFIEWYALYACCFVCPLLLDMLRVSAVCCALYRLVCDIHHLFCALDLLLCVRYYTLLQQILSGCGPARGIRKPPGSSRKPDSGAGLGISRGRIIFIIVIIIITIMIIIKS